MRTLIITAGHSNGKGGHLDKGVSSYNGKHFEGDLTIKLRDRVSDILRRSGYKVYEDSDKNPLAAAIQELKGFFSMTSINVDIHFNSASLGASGTETLVKDKYSKFEYKIAETLSERISSILGIKNRGVKTESMSARGKLGWMRMTGNNIIIEVCFLSNPSDVAKYEDKQDEIADVIAQVLGYYAGI
jgi:N-acetylmuramoyl-L-alanine amidase